MERVTEWSKPDDPVTVVVPRQVRWPGVKPRTQVIPYREWAASEAKRLGGEVQVGPHGMIAVFAGEKSC